MEKTLILALLIFIILGSAYVYRLSYLRNTKVIPTNGGIYIEGILIGSVPALNENITSLTHIGLIRLDENGLIKPAIAKAWDTSPDGKTYTFHLNNKYSAPEVAQYLKNQKGNWSDVIIKTPDNNTVSFTLKQPYGLFLASTLRPILPYGPYIVTEQSKSEITLDINKNAFRQPYIQKVAFKIYENPKDLQSALKKGKINATDEKLTDLPKNINQFSISIPRYNVAFLNCQKITDKNVRKEIISGPAFTKPTTFDLLQVDTESAANFTNSLIKKWSSRNIKINRKLASSAEILSNEIVLKNYDIIVYGLNTGYYNDLYPYWHSSQIPDKGLNYSFLKNKSADRLIEEARITLDDKVRVDKYSQAKNIIINDESAAIFQKPEPYQFYANKQLKGIHIAFIITRANRFSFLDNWYIDTKRVRK